MASDQMLYQLLNAKQLVLEAGIQEGLAYSVSGFSKESTMADVKLLMGGNAKSGFL